MSEHQYRGQQTALPGFLGTLLSVVASSGVVNAQSQIDLWNFDQGLEVRGHSEFDAGFGDFPYDARDIFGGLFTTLWAERGQVVYTDGHPAGTVHWIEWSISEPVTLQRIDAFLLGDVPGSDWRHCSEVLIYARADDFDPWELLVHETQSRDDALDRRMWNVSSTLDSPRSGLREFRAEFVQMSDSLERGGPRVVELDGFGVREPCPADFNDDAVVDTLDVLLFLNSWNSGDSAADFNGDGTVNTLDFLAFLNAWVEGC